MDKTRRRYNRLSPIYHLFDKGLGHGSNRWRKNLFSKIKGPKVLEVGVGTGINLPFYPPGLKVTAIDFSPGMLRYAHRVAETLELDVELLEMDVQALDFAAHTFDTVLTTCVFCSVPDPIQGLREIRRVLKPKGKLIMLEHVLSCHVGLRQFMNLINPFVRSVAGANINRETKNNLKRAGFTVEEEDLWLDIMKIFIARPATKL